MPDRSSERRANMGEARVLRTVFLAGAVTDAVALLPMLLPSFAAFSIVYARNYLQAVWRSS